jgi:glutamate formiminotransferase/formiminotetrahydrofolate cyclodeaminase
MSQVESAARRRPLVLIVPNFSEGRRQEVIDAILAALRVPGVHMLNTQWDPDHNRLDASLVGSPDAVRASAMAGAAKAAELIDMEQHRGSHPRMGAVDVIPFLPIRDVTMQECVELARAVARAIGEDVGLPVYCYDQAALTAERRSLAEVRKGEYEGLKADVAAGRRLPDFGPHEIGRAGAVAVGARKPLVAFNVYLAGRDEEAAKSIARRVRESSGGLTNVRAIGFFAPERDCLTVSLNLIDTDATPIYRAFELVKVEASRHGLAVLQSEIVGLVPEVALSETAAFYLQLEGFNPGEQIVENMIQQAEAEAAPPAAPESDSVRGQKTQDFLAALASERATPGGGTAAAAVAAAGAALVAMVARLTAGRKEYASAQERMRVIVGEADGGRDALLGLADRDADAFDGVMAAYRLPKETDQEKAARSAAIERALSWAAQVPLEVARRAVSLMDLAREVTANGVATAASDGATAAYILSAAAEGALANVLINLGSMKDPDQSSATRAEANALQEQSRKLLAATSAAFRERIS